jgi:Mesyanzhinovviridae DNA polymerase
VSGNLFDMAHDLPATPSSYQDWQPEAPQPIPSNVKDVYLDFETFGIRWDKGDKPGGVAILHAGIPEGRYYPWAHRQGPNLDPEVMRRWISTELKGKRLTNLNTRFEVHMSKNMGADIEATGCEVSDVAHYAALLDDHRRTFNLEALVDAYLFDGEHKVKSVDGMTLDPSRMMDYHPGVIAQRAIADVRQVKKLRDVMWPRMDAENLQRVRALEDRLIYPVCAMERNGAPIDVEKLDRWVKTSEQQYLRQLYRVAKQVGFQINPNSRNDMKRLFKHLHLEDTGSYADAVLAAVDHPLIQDVRKAVKLASLRSKYLVKYRDTIGADHLLRYAMHQLRGDEGGTISGRFSSSALFHREGVGANIQQVMAVAKQRVGWGFDEDDASHDDDIYVIRDLFIPAAGNLLFGSDAMQIEYRKFASKIATPRILAAYAADIKTNFHKLVWAMVKELAPYVTYKQQKNLNFAYIYGAGLPKLCFMLGLISEVEFNAIAALPGFRRDGYAQSHNITGYAAGKKIKKIYETVLPEVSPTLKACIRQAEEEGFVATFLGRRCRFPDRDRMHKALNAEIQGGAAEDNKVKVCEAYESRKETGFVIRYSVHDELVGDVPDRESAHKLDAILNHQTFPEYNKVPILWESGVGPSWARLEDL